MIDNRWQKFNKTSAPENYNMFIADNDYLTFSCYTIPSTSKLMFHNHCLKINGLMLTYKSALLGV